MSMDPERASHLAPTPGFGFSSEATPYGVAVPSVFLFRTHTAVGRVFGNALRLRHAWVALAGIALLDAIWSRAIGFTLSGYAPSILLAIELLGVTTILRWGWRDPRLAIATEAVALWLAFTASSIVLTYLSATPALPLQDELLASADAALGFHWLVLFHWVGQHPGVGRLLATCYDSLLPELLALTIWLSWRRHERRFGEFFWIAGLAILLTSLLSAVMPVASAYVLYGLPDRAIWLHDFDALRERSNLHFALPDTVGVVQFPSFHTTLALLVIYTVRGTGVVGRVFMAWNLIMLFSIPPMGGHYLVDMIGGAAVLAISIGLVRGLPRLHRKQNAHID